MKMNHRIRTIVLLIGCLAVLAACSKTQAPAPAKDAGQAAQDSGTQGGGAQGGGQTVGMPNPWTDHKTHEDAEKAAGFAFALPDVLEGCKAAHFRTLGDTMIEVIYTDAAGQEAYRLRKGKGQEDISGDYNSYAVKSEAKIGGTGVSMQGDADGIRLMSFHSETFSYSFTAGTAVPDEDRAEQLAAEIIDKNRDF